jgi:hypothetical protein
MSKQTTITQDKFDKMLAWLDHDREVAGRKYENIRRSLIRILTWRNCNIAEDLADEAVNVVIFNIDELAESYVGMPELYFYGVARKLLRRYYSAEKQYSPMPDIAADEFALQQQRNRTELLDRCLTRCMQELNSADAQLILGYYQGDKQNKIDNRRRLAGDLAPNTFRVKAHRIRARLEKCVKRCFEQNSDGMY